MLKTTFVLALLYSPMSQYFSGWSLEKFDSINAKDAKDECLMKAAISIGEELKTTVMWEKETMGPRPKVIAAFCAEGFIAK